MVFTSFSYTDELKGYLMHIFGGENFSKGSLSVACVVSL